MWGLIVCHNITENGIYLEVQMLSSYWLVITRIELAKRNLSRLKRNSSIPKPVQSELEQATFQIQQIQTSQIEIIWDLKQTEPEIDILRFQIG